MSRDVLTVGSTMRIPLLYQGEYSQWVERFMNYLEEQTDGEAMINLIKNGDQPLPRVTQVSIAGTTSTEQPPLKDKSMWSAQEKRVQKIDRLYVANDRIKNPKITFLNGFINEEVYVAQPPGFINFQKPNYIYKLKKELYGLKQSPKAWYDRLKAFLRKYEYSIGMVDNTLFTKKSKSHLIIVQIYVDGIIFGSTSQYLCDDFAKIMHDEFEMSMMGELNFFLGLQIKQMKDEIFFNQSKYIKEMLKKFGLEDFKTTKTLMSTEIKITKDDEADSVDSSKYQGMIGSLLYLTASRPDIMFSVCLCARFRENPKNTHLEAVKFIFRYIRGTNHLGLWYPKGTKIETVVYADSDHAGDYVDRKSTSGVCKFMGCFLTSWFAKKQTALAISTSQAEYVFAGKACQQALWIKQALIDYGIRLDNVPIMCDNKGAIDLSKNPIQHSRTKHIEIRHHFLRDNVQKSNFSIEKVASEDNIADIFTKPLERKVFNYLRLGLGMIELIKDSDPSSSQKRWEIRESHVLFHIEDNSQVGYLGSGVGRRELILIFCPKVEMSRDVLTVGSTMRIPLLYRGEYSQWVERFMNYLEEQTDGEAMVNSIKNGDQPLPRVTQVSIAGTTSTEQPPLKDKFMWSDQEKRIQKIDRLARSLLIQGLPNDIYSLIDSNKTAKDLWDALARHMLGSEYGEQDRKAAVLYEYETFKATEGEFLLETYIRYLQVIDDLKKCGYSKDNCELNFKFLNNLQPVETQNQGDVNDTIGSKKKTVVVTSDPLALIAEKTKVSKSKEKVVVSSDSEGSGSDDFSELNKITALLEKAFNQRKFYSKPTKNDLRTSSSSQSANKKQEFVKTDNKRVEKKDDEKKRDMSKVKCYNCKKEGHFAKDCKKAKVKDYEYYKTKMLLAKKDKDEQVLLAEDQALMESSSDSDQEINANMVFMDQIEKVLSDSEASSS
nr:retrovirus-related Pol polyprotein from transposon TNT 1-94 [Tanacetum cinerariifolium]